MNVAVLARHHIGNFAAFARCAQTLANAFEQAGAALFVADVARQHVGRRGAFAQVVAQAGKTHRQRRAQLRGHVQHHHQVNAGVNLRMVFGALRNAPQPVNFGQQVSQRTAVAQHLQHARRLVFHQPACQFLPDALGHQRIDFAMHHHVPHQRHRFRCDRKVGKARRKTRQPQNAYRVFAKGIGDMAQHFGLQVALPAVRID